MPYPTQGCIVIQLIVLSALSAPHPLPPLPALSHCPLFPPAPPCLPICFPLSCFLPSPHPCLPLGVSVNGGKGKHKLRGLAQGERAQARPHLTWMGMFFQLIWPGYSLTPSLLHDMAIQELFQSMELIFPALFQSRAPAIVSRSEHIKGQQNPSGSWPALLQMVDYKVYDSREMQDPPERHWTD